LLNGVCGTDELVVVFVDEHLHVGVQFFDLTGQLIAPLEFEK
jgi:hypothetical protein